MRRVCTIGIWTIALLSLAAAGLVATLFVFMAAGMDPTDVIQGGSMAGGVQPWLDAIRAVAGFVALLVLTIVALRLWHTERYRSVGAILTLVQAGAVAWVCATVYAEYF